MQINSNTRVFKKFMGNGIKGKLHFHEKGFEIYAYSMYSKTSQKIHIMKNYAWISKYFCTKNLPFVSIFLLASPSSLCVTQRSYWPKIRSQIMTNINDDMEQQKFSYVQCKPGKLNSFSLIPETPFLGI